MAQRKKKKNFMGLRDIKKLWSYLPVVTWLELLREISPEHQWSQTSPTQITGKCPYHDDKTPSFKLFFNKKYGKCFGSCQKFVDDIVNLVAKLRGNTYSEALIFLHKRYGLGQLIDDHSEELVDYNHTQEMKKHAAIAMREIINDLIRDKHEYLDYLKPGLSYLVNGRGIPRQSIMDLPVGLLGKSKHLKAHIPEQYHEAFDAYFGAVLSKVTEVGNIVFHYNDSPGSISRFKIRKLNRRAIAALKDTDPMSLSSEEAKKLGGASNEAYFLKDKYYENKLGLFGMHKYQYLLGLSDTNLYVTEGEFDVLSVMAEQDRTGTPDFIMLGTCGSGSMDVELLTEYGIRAIWVVPDHPSKQGDSYAINFLKQVSDFDANNIKLKIFSWDTKMTGGDLDDLIQQYGYAEVRDALHVRRNATFLDALYWVAQRTDRGLEELEKKKNRDIANLDSTATGYETRKKSIEHEYHTDMVRLLKEKVSILPSTTDKLFFMEKYKEETKIDLSKIDNISSQIYNLTTFEGVMTRVTDALKEHVNVAFYNGDTDQKWKLHLWSKKQESLFALSLQDRGFDSIFSTHVGKVPTDWMDNIIGNSPIYLEGCPDPDDSGLTMKTRKIKQKNANALIVESLNRMAANIPAKDDLMMKAQGVHFVLPDEDLEDSKGVIYFVNGAKLFKGWWNREQETVEWERIDNIVDGNIRFNLNKNKKWSFVKDTTDLYQGNTTNLKDLFEKVLYMVDGWKLEHHEVHRLFLALNIMTAHIQPALGYVNILFLIGDPESGKTTLVHGLMSGVNAKGVYGMRSIMESGSLYTNPTQASIYANVHECTLPTIIDEAGTADNNPESPHEKMMAGIRQIFLNVPTGGGAITRFNNNNTGGDTNQINIYNIVSHLVMASPSLPSDSMFLTRCFMLYTVREQGRKFPGAYISEKFSRQEVEEIRRAVTVGVIPRIYELRELIPKLKARILEVEGVKKYDRFINTLMAPLALYELMGYDAVSFAKKIIDIHKKRLDDVNNEEQDCDVLNDCLYANVINTISEQGNSMYVAPISLIKDKAFAILNNSSQGVYYLPERNWLVIVWRQVKVNILSRTKHGYHTESFLKEKVSKNKYLVPISKQDHEYIQEELRLWDIKSPSGYSVFDGDYLGQAVEKAIPQEGKVTFIRPQHKVLEQDRTSGVAIDDSKIEDIGF